MVVFFGGKNAAANFAQAFEKHLPRCTDYARRLKFGGRNGVWFINLGATKHTLHKIPNLDCQFIAATMDTFIPQGVIQAWQEWYQDFKFDDHAFVLILLFSILVGIVILVGIFYIAYYLEVGRDEPPPPILKAADHTKDGKYHLLLAATGSVATIKIPNILHALSKYDNLSIRLVLSDSAAEFLSGQSAEQPSLKDIAKIKNVEHIYRDSDEWRKPWIRGDNILHIELRRWADLMVIAPLSANSLAKLALGMSGDLVSSVARAWDATGLIDGLREGIRLSSKDREMGKKTIMVAPAMNTAMWNHPVTARHLNVLSKEWGISTLR